jgi:hypothetical protein
LIDALVLSGRVDGVDAALRMLVGNLAAADALERISYRFRSNRPTLRSGRPCAVALLAPGNLPASFDVNVRDDFHVVRVGVNYF